jgi:hypothetical protein
MSERMNAHAYVEMGFVGQSTCHSVCDDIFHPRKHVFWRRYRIHGIFESQIHLLLHLAGLTESPEKIDFSEPGCAVPCYRHGDK